MENAFSPGKECPKNNSTILCPLDAKIDHQSTMINVELNCFSSPTRQIFTHMETLPLQMKGFKFLPILSTSDHQSGRGHCQTY